MAKSGDASKPTEERVTLQEGRRRRARHQGRRARRRRDCHSRLRQGAQPAQGTDGQQVTRRLLPAAALLASACVPHTRIQQPAPVAPQVASDLSRQVAGTLRDELNRIFDDPVLARALVGVRVESLSSGAVLYERNADRLVIPASNMKIVDRGRCRTEARLGLPLRDAARVGRHHRGWHAPGRPRRHRQRRSVDWIARRRTRAALSRMGRRSASSRHPAGRRPTDRRRQRVRRRRARRRLGVGLPGGRATRHRPGR